MILSPMHVSLRILIWWLIFFFCKRNMTIIRWSCGPTHSTRHPFFPGYMTFSKVYNLSSYSGWPSLCKWRTTCTGRYLTVTESSLQNLQEFDLQSIRNVKYESHTSTENRIRRNPLWKRGTSNSRMIQGASCHLYWDKGKCVCGIKKVECRESPKIKKKKVFLSKT